MLSPNRSLRAADGSIGFDKFPFRSFTSIFIPVRIKHKGPSQASTASCLSCSGASHRQVPPPAVKPQGLHTTRSQTTRARNWKPAPRTLDTLKRLRLRGSGSAHLRPTEFMPTWSLRQRACKQPPTRSHPAKLTHFCCSCKKGELWTQTQRGRWPRADRGRSLSYVRCNKPESLKDGQQPLGARGSRKGSD